MDKITFLGGTKQVGRSGFLLQVGGVGILLDYGVALNDEPGFPMHVRPSDVDLIVLSHAHLDHSGATPVFYIRGRKPMVGTPPTFDLTRLLLFDFIKISGYYLPFEYIDVEAMMKSVKPLGYGESVRVGDVEVKLVDAGHIPGSCQVLVEAGGRRILYTGDINTRDTRLIRGSSPPDVEVDILIIESTYADSDHEDRLKAEMRFVQRVREVVEGGGTVLVPAFAVGRSQEIANILYAHGFEHDVYMDGMAREVNRILLDHPEFLRDPNTFRKALARVKMIGGRRDRRRAVRRPCVIISPSGMLKGGAAMFYMERVAMRSENAVFLVSYQLPDTPGRKLLDEGKFIIRGREVRVRAAVEHFDFSSHCGRSELHEYLKSVKGNPDVYVVHGEPENCELLASWIRDELGLRASAPEAGDIVRLG